MKVFVYSMVFLVLMLIGFFVYSSIMAQSTNDFLMCLNELQKNITDENWEQGLHSFEQLKKQWQKTEGWSTALIDHAELRNISEIMASMEVRINYKDKVRVLADCSALSFFIVALRDNEELSLKNIL